MLKLVFVSGARLDAVKSEEFGPVDAGADIRNKEKGNRRLPWTCPETTSNHHLRVA